MIRINTRRASSVPPVPGGAASSREPVNPAVKRFAVPPDPGQAGTLDDLVERLRLLKVWAGDPSYERITDRMVSDPQPLPGGTVGMHFDGVVYVDQVSLIVD